jgi:hypothetical protein
VLPASAAGSVEDVKPDEAAAVTADPEDAAHPAGDAGGDDEAMGDPGRGDDRDRGDAEDGSAADGAGADDATVATVRSDE